MCRSRAHCELPKPSRQTHLDGQRDAGKAWDRKEGDGSQEGGWGSSIYRRPLRQGALPRLDLRQTRALQRSRGLGEAMSALVRSSAMADGGQAPTRLQRQRQSAQRMQQRHFPCANLLPRPRMLTRQAWSYRLQGVGCREGLRAGPLRGAPQCPAGRSAAASARAHECLAGPCGAGDGTTSSAATVQASPSLRQPPGPDLH